jgi:hypothetical protein
MNDSVRFELFAKLRPLSLLHSMSTLVSVFMLTSCAIFDREEPIPSYVGVSQLDLQTTYQVEGSNSHAITDCWLYVDDELIGVFEPPFAAPVLAEGQSKVELRAGIKKNGIAASRVAYPFFRPFVDDSSLVLNPESEHILTPSFEYLPSVNFVWKEDFEDLSLSLRNASGFQSDLNLERSNQAFEGSGFGLVELNSSAASFKAYNSDPVVLPQFGAEVYLEMDYRCDSEFEVGYKVNYARGGVFEQSMVILNPTSAWRKIYIELGEEVSEETNALSFEIFFLGFLPDSMNQSEIAIDNLKLVHE